MVAAGVPIDAPIVDVMSAPARTVTADLTAETVLMDMLECGLRHMPVVSSRGEVVGVLEEVDLLAASARQSFTLRRSIGLAGDAVELQKVGQRVTGVAADLFRNGTKASATTAILSVVIDRLVRQGTRTGTRRNRHRSRRIRVADTRQCCPPGGDAVIRRRQRPVVAGRHVIG